MGWAESLLATGCLMLGIFYVSLVIYLIFMRKWSQKAKCHDPRIVGYTRRRNESIDSRDREILDRRLHSMTDRSTITCQSSCPSKRSFLFDIPGYVIIPKTEVPSPHHQSAVMYRADVEGQLAMEMSPRLQGLGRCSLDAMDGRMMRRPSRSRFTELHSTYRNESEDDNLQSCCDHDQSSSSEEHMDFNLQRSRHPSRSGTLRSMRSTRSSRVHAEKDHDSCERLLHDDEMVGTPRSVRSCRVGAADGRSATIDRTRSTRSLRLYPFDDEYRPRRAQSKSACHSQHSLRTGHSRRSLPIHQHRSSDHHRRPADRQRSASSQSIELQGRDPSWTESRRGSIKRGNTICDICDL